jgi:glycosyltransferase involved in cell wall biosynthesis
VLFRSHQQIRAEKNPYCGPEIQIVSVGRLNYQKGFDLLLRAFHRCHGRLSNTRLTVVGEGPEEGSLRMLAQEYGISGAVSFVGQKMNPFPYMVHADFLVLSSRWEGSPNTVLEALGCGTPVLAFDCPGGTAEIITEGKNGWLVPAEDWEGLAERMIRIVEGKAWSGLKGGNLVPERHRCGNVVHQWEAVLVGEV